MSIVLKKHIDKYFATCPKGFEPALKEELKKFNCKKIVDVSRGVYFECDKVIISNVLINSRISSKIYLVLFDFFVKKEKDIYLGIKSINWPRLFKVDQTFKFLFTQGVSLNLKKKSYFKNTQFLSMLAKDALVDRFKQEINKRPSIDTKAPDVSIHCHLEPNDNKESRKEKVIVMLDLIGKSLGHRGYRRSSQLAPIRENLAAGLLDYMDFKDENFIDLTCGSGTFLFEAFIKAYKISPRFSDFQGVLLGEKIWNFQKYSFLDSISKSKEFLRLIKKENNHLKDVLESEPHIIIHGNDFSRRIIEETQRAISNLGVSNFISLSSSNAIRFEEYSFEKNLLFSNPPFGNRLGEIDEKTENLYYELGENFKNTFKESRFGIISSERSLLKKISLKPSLKHPFTHGGTDCLLYLYNQF